MHARAIPVTEPVPGIARSFALPAFDPPPPAAALAALGPLVQFARGAVLFDAGQPATELYEISEGVVKLCHVAADGGAVLSFLFAGDLVGMVGRGRHAHRATAVAPVVARRLPTDALMRRMEADPGLQMRFLRHTVDALARAQRHAWMLTHHAARVRVALFLDDMRERLGGAGDARAIRLPMRRADIAAHLALTVEALSRTLRGLERDGVLCFQNPSTLTIADEVAFRTILDTTR